MSVQAISWVLSSSRSTGANRLVLISIANHVNPDGEGWVHVNRVLSEANVSEDSYRRAVAWAVDNGELERDLQAGGNPSTPPRYRPNLFRFTQMRPPQPAHPADLRPPHPADPRPPQDAPPRPPQDAPHIEAVYEPSSEPREESPLDPTELLVQAARTPELIEEADAAVSVFVALNGAVDTLAALDELRAIRFRCRWPSELEQALRTKLAAPKAEPSEGAKHHERKSNPDCQLCAGHNLVEHDTGFAACPECVPNAPRFAA